MLEELLQNTLNTMNFTVKESRLTLHAREIGTIVQIGGGIARVRGLPNVSSEELVHMPAALLESPSILNRMVLELFFSVIVPIFLLE